MNDNVLKFPVSVKGTNMNKHVMTAFSILRFIVTVGWFIYARGYVFGYLMAGLDDDVVNFSVAANAANVNKHIKAAFSILGFIVTVDWSIYALGMSATGAVLVLDTAENL